MLKTSIRKALTKLGFGQMALNHSSETTQTTKRTTTLHDLTPQSAARWRDTRGGTRISNTSAPQQTSVEQMPNATKNENSMNSPIKPPLQGC